MQLADAHPEQVVVQPDPPLQVKAPHAASGSVPAAYAVQVPGVVAQLSHAPPQAESQQKPSVQWPVAHWQSAVQAALRALSATQLVPEQYVPALQLAVLQPLQVVAQVEPPPQVNEPQAFSGSVPAAYGVHDPGVVAQLSQAPPQVALQQKPSAQ